MSKPSFIPHALALLVASASIMLSACNQATPAANASEKPNATAESALTPLIIAPEDTLSIEANSLGRGPVVTGAIQAERKADLRAEVSAVVLQVLKENGEFVKRGDILVRLDETSIRDQLNSAQDAAKNAVLALEQTERSLQRLKTLRASGMTSLAALDEAENHRNAALSEVSASKARVAQAAQTLQRTVIRAPFDGVVTERRVSAGDTAGAGKELVKVIDPASMRFEGRVSADKVGLIKVGQVVSFKVNGYGQELFLGKITRVDAAASDVTRQVQILVAFTNQNRPKVAGLYAEGNVEAQNVTALLLPEAALVKAGDKTYVWRVKAKSLTKVELKLGARDVRTGDYEVLGGIAQGDVIMRSPSSTFKEGQSVSIAAVMNKQQ